MRRRVAVVFGGRSAEHEISCLSARAVIDALDDERYEVIPIGITKQGSWHLLAEPPPLAGGAPLPSVRPTGDPPVTLSQEPGASSIVAPGGELREIDVVFPVLHGPYGEDGAMQGLLELAGIPYVGAGVLGSAVGMDKAVQKVLFAAAGLPVVDSELVHERDWQEDPDEVVARAGELGYPLFAKAATLGSSVGVAKVHDPGELRPGLEQAFRYARKALLEVSIEGAREIECAVLGNDDPVASIAGEIVPAGEFYDYASKYLDEGSRLVIPAELPGETIAEIQRMAVAAFQTIDCAGMARVDFFVRETPGEGRVWVNEINTIPGFTAISMYPKLWEASGVGYAELVDRLLDLAIERHALEAKRGTGAAEVGGAAGFVPPS